MLLSNAIVGSIVILVFSPGLWWWRWCSWACNPFTMAMRRRGCRGRTWDRRNPTKATVGLRGRNALTGNPVPEGYSRITSNSNSWCGLYHKRRRHIIWRLPCIILFSGVATAQQLCAQVLSWLEVQPNPSFFLVLKLKTWNSSEKFRVKLSSIYLLIWPL